jgi:hypothetical protein
MYCKFYNICISIVSFLCIPIIVFPVIFSYNDCNSTCSDKCITSYYSHNNITAGMNGIICSHEIVNTTCQLSYEYKYFYCQDYNITLQNQFDKIVLLNISEPSLRDNDKILIIFFPSMILALISFFCVISSFVPRN